jgi:hypothetical protein
MVGFLWPALWFGCCCPDAACAWLWQLARTFQQVLVGQQLAVVLSFVGNGESYSIDQQTCKIQMHNWFFNFLHCFGS